MAKDALLKCIILCLVLTVCTGSDAKLMDEENKTSGSEEPKPSNKLRSTSALVFADELRQTLERYIFGICPPTYKVLQINRGRNSSSTMTCDLDNEQNDLAGRLATLSLRAHSAARGECTQLGAALANMFGELARTAANRHALAASSDANKKRKLSKSQKAKIQAKQRTALAVKKKAQAAQAQAKMAA